MNNLPTPGAPNPSFMERVTDFATEQQFKKLGQNLTKSDIITWLEEVGPDGAGAWGGFTAITDELVDVEPAENPDYPMAPTLKLTFDTHTGCRDFHRLFLMLLAGIKPDPQMPRFEHERSRQPQLIAENFTYPDLSTGGRVGTVLLRQEYSDVPGIHWLSQTLVNRLVASDISVDLPANLTSRVHHQAGISGESPLSSGHLALIGKAMREILGPLVPQGATLAIQRPWKDRPHIEKQASFFPTRGTAIPLSELSITQMVAGQVRERVEEFKEPFVDRSLTKATETIWDVATGLGILQSGSIAVRALGTFIAALGVASWGVINQPRKRGD